ncbi:extracellular solute-binding protein [Acuticoccus sp. 2012]|uniref:Extracellular solute-binding protein n=2 Tax=Acuticoccus mangrovi TaxID=2796142 RepID=A0A934IMB2_9HYPH|nr:extracellular solute-binding protein [Acuticoccus mangrovi]MBJ3774525.1 extracellular solute-binding protein [Acuticoccus mangrovi]
MKAVGFAAIAAALCAGTALPAIAQDKEITLCWAAWDPANALVELSKDFTAQSGVKMNFEFVPWTSFADRMLNELNSGGKLCDLMIGDSQWIGGGATYGHYVKLNDFFDAEGISMDDFLPAAVDAYSAWPKGSDNYYALPAMGDAVGWVYRKDWFEKPEIQAAFKEEYGRDLAPPKTWDELLEVGKFFQGREIDGETRYGAAIYTERGSEGITMGVTNALYPYGFKYENEPGSYDMEGAVNSPEAVKGLEVYKALYECCTPPGHSDAYMTEDLDAYKSGQTALQMNFFAFFPGIAKDPEVGGETSGFFVNPSANQAASVLGGQGISVVAYSDNKPEALEYIKWFAQPEVQQKWWALGGYAVHNAVVEDPNFPESTPFAAQFLEAMSNVKDFWQEPIYAELLQAMQKRVHDYVVADQGTAQEALDKLIEDWTISFEDDGKL